MPSHFHLIHLMYQSSSHSFHVPKPNSLILSFISIWFILQIIVHLIHFHNIWFCSYYIILRPHCLFYFFNQSRLWKLRVSLDKILIRNIYCIIWNWTPMVLLSLLLHKNHNTIFIDRFPSQTKIGKGAWYFNNSLYVSASSA